MELHALIDWLRLNFFKFLASIIVISLMIGLPIGYFIMEHFKKSEAFEAAYNHAKNEITVKNKCGEVTGIGFMVGGEITNSAAELTFTILGSQNDLKVYYELTKQPDGTWKVDSFKF